MIPDASLGVRDVARPPAEPAAAGPGRRRQADIYQRGVLGGRPAVPTSWPALDRLARRRLSRRAYGYIAGGAGAEQTMQADLAAFRRRTLVPRMLRGLGTRDAGVDLFGRRLPAPLLLAPIGALGIVHPQADVAVARAAADHGVPYIFSNQASRSMEDCAAVMGNAPRWFQLYWSTSDALVASFVRRAEAAGCDAIVVTVDTSMLGWRPRDLDQGYLPFALADGIAQYTSDPVFAAMVAPRTGSAERARPRLSRMPATVRSLARMSRNIPGPAGLNLGTARAVVQTFLETYSRPTLSWDDLPALRAMTSLPIVLKGLQHGQDARRAVDAGVDGIIVSTHGGRQVDGARGALDSLPEVVAAVDGAIPVLMDSGIRGGADIVKAVALGATAVCLGRPYALALGLAGRVGVSEVLANILAELDLTLALCGYGSPAELGPDALAGRVD